MLGLGAALYFLLPTEPPAWIAWAAALAALAAGVAAAFASRAGMVLALLAALALGFAAAKFREERVAAPVLSHELTLHLTGRVLASDPAPRGVRLVVDDLRSGGFAGFVPGRARITVMKGGEAFHAGDGISLTARLLPPPAPSEPGDSDFGRDLYFQRIGAVGFAYGAPIPRHWRRRRPRRRVFPQA
jgi:competence protein ComEC